MIKIAVWYVMSVFWLVLGIAADDPISSLVCLAASSVFVVGAGLLEELK